MPRDKQMLMFYAEIVPTNLSSVRYTFVLQENQMEIIIS